MGRTPDFRDCIGRSQGKPYRGQERKIGKVVAHIRDLVGRKAEPAEERGKKLRFVFDPLVNLLNTEVGHPTGNGRGGPSGNDSHLQPRELSACQGETILDVKDLPLLAARTVVQSSVREDSVNIENQKPDGSRSTRERPGRSSGAGSGHTILARRMSWRWMIPAGRPRASTMTSWVMA